MKANTKELSHALHPWRTYIRWGIFYSIVLIIAVTGLAIYASKIQSYHLPTGAVTLTVPYKTYLVGEPITFTITNNYNSTIYIANSCPGEPLNVYRYEDNAWKRIHDTTKLSSCSEKSRQVAVPAHGQQEASYDQWLNLFKQPGKYRIVAYVDYFNAAPYQDFEVIAKPEVAAPSTKESPAITTQSSPTSGVVSSPAPTASPAPSVQEPATTPTTNRTSKLVSIAQGTISLQYDETTVYILSVQPTSGCRYEANGTSGNNLEVTFKCTEDETQVELSVRNGVFSYEIDD